jgi:hypothetical protein
MIRELNRQGGVFKLPPEKCFVQVYGVLVLRFIILMMTKPAMMRTRILPPMNQGSESIVSGSKNTVGVVGVTVVTGTVGLTTTGASTTKLPTRLPIKIVQNKNYV